MRTILKAVTKKSDSSRQLLRSADHARDAKDYHLAAKLYLEYLGQHPDNGPIHVQCGHMNKELGLLDEAGRHYQIAAGLLPGDADLHLQLGHYYKVTDRFDEAIAAYRKAVELAPANQDAAFQLSEATRLKATPDRSYASPNLVLLARAKVQSAPADFLRNVPAGEFLEAVGRVADMRTYFLLDGLEQRFPDPALDDDCIVAVLRLCFVATAFELAARIVTAVTVSQPDVKIPLNLLRDCLSGCLEPREARLIAIPLHAQLAMLGAATNIMARQRSIIDRVTG